MTLILFAANKNPYNDVVCIFQSGFCKAVRCILTIIHLWPKRVWLDRGFNYTPQSAPNGSVTQGVSASKATTKGPPLPRQTLRSSLAWPSVRPGPGPPPGLPIAASRFIGSDLWVLAIEV